MDINDLRVTTTVLSFAVFVGIVLRAWSRRSRSEHEQAAQLVFLGERESKEPGHG